MARARLVLTFPPDLAEKPITYRLVKDFDLAINILAAKIAPNEEGKLVVEVENSSQEQVDRGISFLVEQGLNVKHLEDGITWNRDECTNCGACTAVCFSRALAIGPPDWTLSLDAGRCVACGLCVNACPLRLISVTF